MDFDREMRRQLEDLILDYGRTRATQGAMQTVESQKLAERAVKRAWADVVRFLTRMETGRWPEVDDA